MIKNKKSLFGILLLSASVSFLASCSAPGSSNPIQKQDPLIELKEEGSKFDPNAEKPNVLKHNENQFISTSSNLSIFSSLASPNLLKNKSPFFIEANEKIRYVAFGDSISAGLDGTLPKDYPGELKNNNTIDGISYPAFLARMLNENNRVEFFKNYAISGSTALDWLNFLENDFDGQIKPTKLPKIYGKNSSKVLAEFKNNLKNANLVTFNIGANDFFQLVIENIKQFDLIDIYNSLTKDEPEYGKILKFVNEVLGKSLSEINKRINTLVANIKVLAPNANINLIGYPVPFLTIKEFIDAAFKKILADLSVEIKPLDYLVDFLNKGLQSVAKITGINYINLFNNDYWNKNITKFSTLLFDIHPNTLGYKKMAMDLYLKLTNEKFNFEDADKFDFNEKYISSDADTLTYQIEPVNTSTIVLGQNTDEYINNKSSIEINLDKLRDLNNFGTRLFELTNFFDEIFQSGISVLLQQEFYKELDPDSVLKKMLFSSKSKENFDDFNAKFENSQIVQDSLLHLQIKVKKLIENNQFQLSNLPSIISETFLTEKNISKFIGVIAKSKFLKNNKDELKQFLSSLLRRGLVKYKNYFVNLLTNEIVKFANLSSNKKSISDILNKLFEMEDFKNILDLLANIFVDHSENFENVENYSDIIVAFMKNASDFNKVSNSISNIIANLLENPEIKNIVSNILYEILKENKLDTNITFESTNNFTNDVIDLTKKSLIEKGILRHFITGIFNNLSINSNENIKDSFFKSFQNSFYDFLNFDNSNEKLIDIAKLIFDSNVLQKNKNFILQLIKNILNSDNIKISNLIVNTLNSTTTNQINLTIGINNFEKLLDFVLKLDKTKETIIEVIENIVNNSKDYSSFNTWEDLIKKVLNSIDLDSIKTKVQDILNSIVNSTEIQPILVDALSELFKNVTLDPLDSKNAMFINDFASSFKDLVNYIGINDQLIDAVFSKLKEAQQSENSFEKLKEVPIILIDTIIKKATNDPFNFIKGIFDLQFLKNSENKEVFAKLIHRLYRHLIKQDLADDLISKLIKQFLAPELIENYLDLTEIKNNIKVFLNLDSTSNLIEHVLIFAITKTKWDSSINNFDQLGIYLVNDPEFKTTFKPLIDNLIIEILNNINLEKTTLKSINYILQKYEITLDNDKLKAIIPSIQISLKELWKNPIIKENILKSLFGTLENINTFSDFIKTFEKQLVDNLNIKESSEVVNLLLKTNLFTNDRENLKEILLSLINQIQQSKQKDLLIDDLKLINLLKPLKIEDQEAKEFIKEIISNDDFINIIKTILVSLIDQTDELSNSTSYADLLNKAIIEKDYIQQLKPNFIGLIKSIMNNKVVIQVSSTSLHKYLVKAKLDKNLTEDQTNKVVSQLFTLFSSNELINQFIENFSNSFLDNIYVKGLDNLFDSIFKAFQNSIELTFDFSHLGDQKIIELINEFTNSNLINDNKDYFKNLFSNIVDKLETLNIGKLLYKFLSGETKEIIDLSFDTNQFENFVNLIVKLDNTKTILKSIFYDVVDNVDQLKNAKSFNDLLGKLINAINFDQIKNPTKELINSLLELDEFKILIKNIFINLYKKLELDPTLNHNQKFIEDISNNIKETIDTLDLFGPIVDALFVKLNEASTSVDPFSVLQTIPDQLFKTLTDKIKNNPKDFLEKIFNLSWIKDNKQALKDLIKVVYNVLQKSGILANIINSNISTILLEEPTSNYVDANEITDLLIELTDNENFKAILFDTFDLLIDNQDWINHLNSAKDFVNSILNLDNFNSYIEKLKEPLKEIFYKLFENDKLYNTAGKALYKFTQDQGFTFEEQDIKTVGSHLINSLVPYLENLNLTDKIIDNVISLIISEKDLDKFIKKLPEVLTNSFDFNDFNILKYLLTSELFNQDSEIFEKILTSFVEQLAKKDLLDKLIDQFNLSEILKIYNLETTDIDNLNALFKNTLKTDNAINLIKKITSFIIQNATNLSQANSYEEFAYKILKNSNFISSIKNEITTLLKSFLANETIQKLLGHITNKAIKDSDFSWILENVNQSEQLFTKFFKLTNELNDNFNLINKVFEGILDFANDDLAVRLSDLTPKILDRISSLFKGENAENNIIKLIKLINTHLIKDNSDKLNKIIENIYNKLSTDSSVIDKIWNFIPKNIQDKINEYISIDDQKYLIYEILKNQDLKEFILDGINNFMNSTHEFEKINNYNDLIKAIVKQFDFSTKGKKAIKSLIDLINSDDRIKIIIKALIEKIVQLEYPELSNEGREQFISDVVDNIIQLVKDLGVYDSIIDNFTLSLSKIGTSDNPLNEFEKILDPILESIKTKFKENNIEFIDKIITSKIWVNNKNFIKIITKFALRKLIENGSGYKLIESAIDNLNTNVLEYFDKQGLKDVTKSLLTIDNLEPITNTLIDYLVENASQLKDKINDKEALLYHILKNSDILTINKNELNNLFIKIINHNSTFKLIQKGLDKWLKDQGYTTDVSDNLALGLQNLIINFNDKDPSQSVFSLLIDTLAVEIKKYDNFTDLFKSLTKDFINKLNLSDFKSIKAILNSELWSTSNKNELKSIIKFLFDKYYIDENVEKIVKLIPLEKIANSIKTTEENVNTLILKVLKSDEIKKLSKNIIEFLIDNIDEFKAANSYDDLIKIIVSNSNFISSIKPDAIAILNLILKDSITRQTLSNIITNFLNEPDLEKIFTGVTDKNSLVDGILSVYDIFDSELGINNIVFSAFVNYLKENGVNFNGISSLVSSIFSAIKDELSNDTETKIATLVRNLSTSNLFTKNKDDILTIINNVISNIPSDEFANLVINLIGTENTNQLEKYIPIDSFTNLIKFVHSNQNFKEILSKSFKTIVENITKFNAVTSYKDIAQKVLEVIDLDTLKTNIQELIKQLLNTQEVKDILLSFIKTTLKNYEVDVEDTEINLFITTFANNINDFINTIDILNPAIDLIFDVLKKEEFKQNPIENLKQIGEKLKELLKDKITNNPKEFADKILALDFVNTNKNGLIKTLVQLVNGLNKQGVIANFINHEIDKIDLQNNLFKYIAKQDLTQLITNVFKYQEINNIFSQLIPNLINNTNWLIDVNDVKKLIWSVLKTENNLDVLKTNFSSLIEKLINEEAIVNSITKIFNEKLLEYNVILNNVDKKMFMSTTLKNLIPLLKKANIYESIYNKIFEVLKTSDSIDEFISLVPNKILEIIKNNHFELIKSLLESDYLTKEKQNYKEFVKALVFTFGNRSDKVEKIITDLKLESKLTQLGVSANETAQAISTLFGINSFATTVNQSIEGILDNAKTIANNSADYNDFVKNIFSNSTFTNQLKTNIITTASDVLKNNTLKTFAAKIATNAIQKSSWKSILENIDNPTQLFEQLLVIIDKFEQEFNFKEALLDQIIDILSKEGYKGNFNLLFDTITKQFSSIFNETNLETNILKIFKILGNSELINNNKKDLKQFILNVLKTVKTKINLGEVIWNKISPDSQAWIENNLFSKSVLIDVANKAINSEHTINITKNFIDYIIDNPNILQNSTEVLGLFRAYFNVEANAQTFKNELKELLKEIFSSTESQTAIKKALTKFFEYLGISNDSNINKLIELLSSDLFNFTDRIGVLDQVLDVIVDLFKDPNVNIWNIAQKIMPMLFEKISPTEYLFAKKIISDELIANNKQVFKDSISSILNAFTNNKEKLKIILQKLGIGKTIVEYDGATIEEMIVDIVSASEIKDIIKIVVNNFIDNGNEYKKLNSWSAAINYLFKNTNEHEIKSKLSIWFKDAAMNKPSLGKGVGAILHQTLINSGFELNTKSDLELMYRVAQGALKGIVLSKNNEFDTILNNLFKNIKEIDFTRVTHPEKALNKAIFAAALSPLLSDDRVNILTSKIFQSKGFFSSISAQIGSDNYVKFINQLFESSSLNKVTGIYKLLDEMLSLNLTGKQVSPNGGQNPADYYWNQKLNPTVKFDSSIFGLKDEITELIKSIISPIYSQMFKQAVKGNWNTTHFKSNPAYKALYRLNTLILWILYDLSGVKDFPINVYWNATYDSVQAYVQRGLNESWKQYFNSKIFKPFLVNKYSRNMTVIGTYSSWKGYSSLDTFVTGNQSSNTYNYNYYDDQVLAYIYYRTSAPKDRHSAKTKTRVLLESLQKGYLGASDRIK